MGAAEWGGGVGAAELRSGSGEYQPTHGFTERPRTGEYLPSPWSAEPRSRREDVDPDWDLAPRPQRDDYYSWDYR